MLNFESSLSSYGIDVLPLVTYEESEEERSPQQRRDHTNRDLSRRYDRSCKRVAQGKERPSRQDRGGGKKAVPGTYQKAADMGNH
jgi:hypothetical protein